MFPAVGRLLTRGAARLGNVAARTRDQAPRRLISATHCMKDDEEYSELTRDFIEPSDLHQAMNNIGVNFYCGVPDSLLKDFCAYITANVPKTSHVITANEGTAIAMASGHYLATGQYSCVYMQNSGLGNIVNPLMSLAHPNVYSIPMLVMMGWRGEPGKRDEPQHVTQGEVTPALLASMNVPFQVLPDYIEGAERALQMAKKYMQVGLGPYVLLVRRRTFVEHKLERPAPQYELNREGALKVILGCLDPKDVVVGTTGMLSRELFEQRAFAKQTHEKDFLTVGAMGHASSIALGISIARPKRRVFCLDGDGAAIMHMGSMVTIATHAGANFKHILINNGAHDSVGGQPTDAGLNQNFNFNTIAKGCGYAEVLEATTTEEIKSQFEKLVACNGPCLLQIRVNSGGHRKGLGRPTRTPTQNKTDFMEFLDRV